MSILYIEPFSGSSGDMCLGALCSLTNGYDAIQKLPQQLALGDGKVEIREVTKNGIVCKHVQVIDQGSMDGNGRPNSHGGHRHLKEINGIIDRGKITEGAKHLAKSIFLILGHAESKVHQIPLEKIHFHEVSGVDSIIDIVGTAVLLDQLQVKKTYAEPVCTGYGIVKTQHGLLPVPAPATADILLGIPQYKGDEEGEKMTPTGAAIIKYLEPDFKSPTLTVRKIGYGPGSREFKNPNVVRMSLLEETSVSQEEAPLYVIESNIDDASAEYLGSDFQRQLMDMGATDFFFTPVQMKKGRPGYKISVLASAPNLKKVNAFILENTSTIGLRYYPVQRERLPRRNFEMETKYGTVRVKEVVKPSGSKTHKIEYESLRELSEKHKISIPQLQNELFHLLSEIS